MHSRMFAVAAAVLMMPTFASAQAAADATGTELLSELGIDPNRAYSAEEIAAFNQQAAAKLGGEVVVDADGGVVIVTSETIEATAPVAGPPIEVLPGEGPTPEGADFFKDYANNQDFGDKNFGGHAHIIASIRGRDAIGAQAREIIAQASAKVTGTVLAKQFAIVEANAKATAQEGKPSVATASILVGGSEVWSGSYSGDTFTMVPKDWSRSFGKVEKSVPLWAGINLDLTAEPFGHLTLTLTGGFDTARAHLTVTPGAYVEVNATAGLSVWILAAGVEGTIRLLTIGIPVTGSVEWPACELLWKLNVGMQLRVLEGKLGAYAGIKLPVIGPIKVSKELFAYKGLTVVDAPLYSKYAATDLGICEF